MTYKQLVRNINAGRVAQKKIWYRTINGYKGNGDKILQINTNGQWVNVTIKDILKILNHLFKNEDKVYKLEDGQQGRYHLYTIITELVNGCSIEDLLERYGDKHKDV